jgi:hypothetical protein
MSILVKEIIHVYDSSELLVKCRHTDLSDGTEFAHLSIKLPFGENNITPDWTLDEVTSAIANKLGVAQSFIALQLDDVQPSIILPSNN